MRRWIVQGLLPALAPALVLVGVLAWGHYSRSRLGEQERFHPPFTAIDCPAPPNLPRDKFLGEVQYLSSLPDALDLLDAETPERLRQAFARHPWVERVEKVEVLPGGGVRVGLVYRTPVLAVSGSFGKAKEKTYLVDGNGVLLPEAEPPPRLPQWKGTSQPPRRRGTPWGDPAVEGAARVAGILAPYLDRLCPKKEDRLTLRASDRGLELSGAARAVIWGRPPGREKPGEPAPEVKLRLLLDRVDKPGPPLDLRTAKP